MNDNCLLYDSIHTGRQVRKRESYDHNDTQDPQLENIHITGAITPEFAEILTPEAVNFVGILRACLFKRRESLLQMRVRRQAEIDAGKMPDFLPETEHIRTSDWVISPNLLIYRTVV